MPTKTQIFKYSIKEWSRNVNNILRGLLLIMW